MDPRMQACADTLLAKARPMLAKGATAVEVEQLILAGRSAVSYLGWSTTNALLEQEGNTMKLTEVPPTRPSYQLDLSFDELVVLAAWSYRHEILTGNRKRLFIHLPVDVQEAARRMSEAQPNFNTTNSTVDWSVAP